MLLLSAFSVVLAAQAFQCGTDVTTAARVSAIHRMNTARVHGLAAPAVAEMRKGMFIVPKTPQNTLFDRPNNLEGKSVRFVPSGSDRYTASVLPLQYDSNVGTTSHTFIATSRSGWQSFRVDLQNVKLPLFGQSVSTIYVNAFNSITLAPPSLNSSPQLDTMAAATTSQPAISPLAMTALRRPFLNWPTAFVRETNDAVLVTWRAANNEFNYDVQARIGANGEILFSYKNVGDTKWGAVVITPGAGSFIDRISVIAQATDPADDINPALDLRSVTVEQVSGTGAYLISATLAADPRSTLPARGDSEVITFTAGNAPPMTVTLAWNGDIEAEPEGGNISGNQVGVTLFSDALDPISNPTRITVETSLLSMSAPSDRATVDVTLNDGPIPGVDLAAADGAQLQLPIIDAFTLPTVDMQAVWESVRAAGPFSDSEIDGVAIFEDFNSDVLLFATAFATIGNSGDDHIWKYVRHGSAYPRAPNLLQMNVIGRGGNNIDPLWTASVLLHEFGHRWLHFVETMENGTATIALNPAPAHPPQFASTPAAFPVVNSYDTSTMGGGYFTQSGNTFTSSPQSPYGYSWVDLYLMGLATPEEVPSTYVIDDSNPPLGLAYNPPSNITVTGKRHDLTIQQVIDAMGPRRPAVASSQHAFKVVFVLVADPSRPVDDDLAKLDQFRSKFVDLFTRATGQRATVQTLFYPPQPRRHAAR